MASQNRTNKRKIKEANKKRKLPDHHEQVEATCTCGAKYKVGSTLASIKLEICAACHPFFKGEAGFVDRERRIEKFNKKYT